MFKKNFIKFCNLHNKAPTMVLLDLGLSKSTFSNWTEESVPRESTLQKIADYFGISIEDLLSENDVVPSVHVNNGIIGNSNHHNAISVCAQTDLGEIEKEILNICKKLDIKRKNALLTRAFELLDEKMN